MTIKDIIEKYENYQLCFVYQGDMYFHKDSVEEVWGDDWNDAPYEHNAGAPYYDKEEDVIVVKINEYYDTKENYFNITEPMNMIGVYTDGFNSYLSVEEINKGDVPWLIIVKNKYTDESETIRIYSGITLLKFLEIMSKHEMPVYMPYIYKDVDYDED